MREDGAMLFSRSKSRLPSAAEALPGRPAQWFRISDRHRVLDAPVVTDEVPEGLEVAIFGLGCFWGAEEIYWQLPGVSGVELGAPAARSSPDSAITAPPAIDSSPKTIAPTTSSVRLRSSFTIRPPRSDRRAR